jgi:short-subunit dehydrogenase
MRIKDAVTVITGASEGIGAACAEEFRSRGAKLALIARTASKLEEIARPGDLCLSADLTREEQRRHLIGAVRERFGRVDILINNAGVGLAAPSWRANSADTRYLFELNFLAPLDLAQQAVADMRPRRAGAIVNIGSVAGRVAMPWFSLYSATKFALGAWTSGIRMELAADNIHAMAVCPGFVRTEFHRHTIGGPPPGALKRGRPAEVTAAEVARRTADGLERREHTVVVPRAAHLLIAAAQLFPALTETMLRRSNARYGDEPGAS